MHLFFRGTSGAHFPLHHLEILASKPSQVSVLDSRTKGCSVGHVCYGTSHLFAPKAVRTTSAVSSDGLISHLMMFATDGRLLRFLASSSLVSISLRILATMSSWSFASANAHLAITHSISACSLIDLTAILLILVQAVLPGD